MPRILSRGHLGPSSRRSSSSSLTGLGSYESGPRRSSSIGLSGSASSSSGRFRRMNQGVKFPSSEMFKALERERAQSAGGSTTRNDEAYSDFDEYDEVLRTTSDIMDISRSSSCFSLFGQTSSPIGGSGRGGGRRSVVSVGRRTSYSSSGSPFDVFRTSFHLRNGHARSVTDGTEDSTDDGTIDAFSSSQSSEGGGGCISSTTSSPFFNKRIYSLPMSHPSSFADSGSSGEAAGGEWGFFIDVAAGEQQIDQYEKYYPRRRRRNNAHAGIVRRT
mmetsp:Transcript_33636/g.77623  ORF Transcript_33636/g.77623 Transcript_33636/m.77623 type:complete len:274 (-) Transcript_33636:779-1600(-)|eukprot:CAMPEP_0113297084 /NCGR_PEP_ID=MMETSP0010_2-20120614/94_1 /TAXON_ID=216773 ORGANISM="Corethron hystrix, Strain 308" /NCGR_SAMPLE_ID=MMETSP0010_2 /ASSEMBLY_ACC=CAM_ASM_000155 /LENGTH=273 /DNA_ID=CAMNT_0000149915 /DNA_START=393 /DNA_END=1214 /DNA_ORIENTATION=- /assembly_acc=CAM_ASM_000155